MLIARPGPALHGHAACAHPCRGDDTLVVFGGRGHDYQVLDKEANANGGMLGIATSIPDEREWIQWKGRTARQDRPGQFYVIMDETQKPFDDPKHKKLRERLRKLSSMPRDGGAESCCRTRKKKAAGLKPA